MSSTKQLKRWIITGIITTETPLHIGDGGFLEGHKQDVERIGRDFNGNPYIPGSSLRGFIRACAERLFAKDDVEDLFGYQKERERGGHADALGGLLQVWDGEAIGEIKTEIRHHVVINRRTRTAAEHLLFAEELICAGSQFSLTFVIDGVAATENHVALLLGVLKHIHEHGFRLGAGKADNLGKVRWNTTAVKTLTEKAVSSWLAENAGKHLNNYLKNVKHIPTAKPITSTNRLLLDIELHFEDLFLVQDPAISKGSKNASPDAASFEAKRRVDNVPYLPASAFLGALRGHAERIARTQEVSLRDVTKPGKLSSAISQYDPVDALFGGVGWCGPLRVEQDFVGNNNSPLSLQQMVAIDRFTGGSANSLLYNARGFLAPVLKGTLSIDVESFKRTSSGKVSLNLLRIVLRDLKNGLIPLGFGSSKGFGHNRAKVRDLYID